MAATISEYYLSRTFEVGVSNGRELVYDIIGTDDELEVQNLLFSTSPGTYQGLSRDSVRGEPLGGGAWKGYARYTRQDDDSEYTFEIGGETFKRTQSLGTTAYGTCPGDYGDYGDYGDSSGSEEEPGEDVPPDFGGAIGVNGDTVEGVDDTAPTYDFSETHLIDDALVTQSYKLLLFNLYGKMNSATFKGFARGECRYMGTTGSKRGDGKWSLTFRFSCSPNVSNLSIGGICGISKLGWDYLWVRYDDFEDEDAFALVKRPRAAYVERICDFGDFSTLGIGT
jgi:hypothetical protein